MSSLQENFYNFQQRRFSLLLFWGLSSALFGLTLVRNPRPFWQQFGLQALLWGMIDAGLALFGLNGADKNEKRFLGGQIRQEAERKDRRNFFRILLVNTGLDVGYVVLGIWLLQRFRTRQDRRGMGLSIVIQGLWLFFFDGLVSREVFSSWMHQ